MASDGTPQAAIPDRDLTGVTQGLTQKEMFEGSLARFGRNEVVNPEVSLVKALYPAVHRHYAHPAHLRHPLVHLRGLCGLRYMDTR